VRRYRTEIVIAADRAVSLQLPLAFPEGRAVVVVEVELPDQSESGAADFDPDRQDIEWWEEFEEDKEPVTGKPVADS
jgi:hypothetical protein